MKRMKQSATLEIEPRFRLTLGRTLAFGPGKADLLEQIAATGTITDAAKELGMSYMRAWSLVKSMDRGFGEPLVRKVRGGNARGGAELSSTGRDVLRLYRDLEARASAAIQPVQQELTTLVARRD